MAERMAVNLASSLWRNYKDLKHTVEEAIGHRQLEAYHDLQVALKKYKPDFISLLQNPAKNAQHRDQIRKGSTQGVLIEGQSSPMILPMSLIDETLIFSDLLNINEYSALEYLVTGEQQLPQFPGVPRGLVAILLYYDTRSSIVQSLRTLIQSHEGKTWTLGLPEDLVSMTTKFTDQLVEEGLTRKILALLQEFDETKELEKLQSMKALGNAKHRKQVSDLIKDIRTGLSDCLFCLACQSHLSKADTLQLLACLKKASPLKADGKLQDVYLSLLMTFMYAMDISVLEQAVEEKQDVADQLPILADDTFVPDVHRFLLSDDEWQTPGLKASLQFVWAVTLRNLAQQPGSQDIQDYIEEDESIIDISLTGKAFQFIQNAIISSKTFHNEEFYVRRLHVLVTDFIIQMPLKVKELRNRGDEAARIMMSHAMEGLNPPANLRRDFEYFMLLIGDLYGTDSLKLQLALEYWCPLEASVSPISGGFGGQYHHRPPQRQVSLFKFVRLAGDLLLPSLYVPYIKMLTGLANGSQCAYHCFNLLKSNGSSAGGTCSSVSWDHFFMSINQYFTSLRQEVPGSHDTHVYRHGPARGITPQELEGLTAVLKLTKQIAKQDETARISLCENQSWLPIQLLFGLLGCSIPPVLKGELLHTLAALAKSPEIAATLWQSLEVSQILPTVQSNQATGIEVELDEIEARNEEFPMTLGFLDFMNVLTDIPIPALLGAGFRSPGFDPYLEFLKDAIFLKFKTRAYRNPEEKWQVAESVLQILYKLMKNYTPQAEDFVEQQVEIQGGGMVSANKPAGYNLMIYMLKDNPMLKLIFSLIYEATLSLDQYTDFPGKANLQKTSLLCLKMIECALEKQETFMDLLREYNASILVAPMDKLLMGINPRTDKQDHLVNITKYVMYNSFNPELALSSVKILYWVTQSSLVQPNLVGMLTANRDISRDILNGFVECLETEDIEELDKKIDEDFEDESSSLSDVRNATRQHIMRVLLDSLEQPSPNLAHYLLGFELRKPVHTTNIQEPGVLSSPRTCLHSVLSLLSKGVESRSGPTCVYDMPVFAMLGYKLIYALCANKDTSGPCMRFLRASHDFFYTHLQHLPFRIRDDADEVLLSNQQSWLLKSVAMEIKVTAANRQRSHTQRLVRLILEDTQTTFRDADTNLDTETTFGKEPSLFESTLMTTLAQTKQQTAEEKMSLLDSLDFCQEAPEPLRLDYLDPGIVERVLTSFEHKDENGVTVCNIQLLHQYLIQELNTLQGSAAAGQRALIQQEIQAVLKNVLARNVVRESLAAKKHAFEAWRQVTEVMLTTCPLDILKPDTRQDVILKLLQDLFKKAANPEARQELIAPVAGVILTLMVNLRQSIVHDQTDNDATQYLAMLDTSSTSMSVLTSQSTILGTATSLTASPLVVVLRGLIEFILQSGGGQQRVRANLYGALLNFLRLPQRPKEITTLDEKTSVLDSVQLSEYEKMVKTNMTVINSYGENLMEMVCRDACDGHEILRMLALSVIDSVVSFDKHQQWLSFLKSKGYLRHLVESIVQNDEALQSMLKPTPEPLKALYIYESKMSLFSRLAERPTGAQELLYCALLNRLSDCKFLSLRPEPENHRPVMNGGHGDDDSLNFVPSVMARYRQLLFPALKLTRAIMTSLGSRHREAASQVMQFLIAHSDVFSAVLRDRHEHINLPALQELALTTGVIYRTATEGASYTDSYHQDQSQLEYQGHLSRIQRQMLALIPRYCSLENWNRELKNTESLISSDGKDRKEEITEQILEISTNVIGYCRAVVTSSASNSEYCRILFTASLSEARSRDLYTLEDTHLSTVASGRPPSLGVLVRHLKQCTTAFIPALESYKQYVRKLHNVAELAPDELRELSVCMGVPSTDKMSTHHKHHLATKRLTQIVQHKAKELMLYYYIIENSLFLLWRHLEFYFIHCQPSDSSSSLHPVMSSRIEKPRNLRDYPSYSIGEELDQSALYDGFPKLAGVTDSVTRQDLEQLKTDAIACLNEAVWEKLLKVNSCYGQSQTLYGFVPAVVRRLQRLLKLHTGI